jgi:hypothetical protein
MTGSRQSGSGMSRKKSTATGAESKRVSSPQTFNLDSSNSDLNIVPDVYFIPDPEFHRDMIIQPTSMLVPGAIQAVTQKLATTPTNHKYPFPTVSRYFIAKARDLKVIGADLLRHRQLILDGEPPFFLHDDHPKLLYVVQLTFKAAKATYRAFKSQVQPKPGDQNMQLIKILMTDCINQYNNSLPQLDMLAFHHGLPLFDEGGEVDETTSLRSEAAQARRRQELDVNLTEQLKDVHTYIANQTQAQNTGLQRR